MNHFYFKDNHLYVENFLVEDLAKEYGTPLYIYSKNQILKNYREINQPLVNSKLDFQKKAKYLYMLGRQDIKIIRLWLLVWYVRISSFKQIGSICISSVSLWIIFMKEKIKNLSIFICVNFFYSSLNSDIIELFILNIRTISLNVSKYNSPFSPISMVFLKIIPPKNAENNSLVR